MLWITCSLKKNCTQFIGRTLVKIVHLIDTHVRSKNFQGVLFEVLYPLISHTDNSSAENAKKENPKKFFESLILLICH